MLTPEKLCPGTMYARQAQALIDARAEWIEPDASDIAKQVRLIDRHDLSDMIDYDSLQDALNTGNAELIGRVILKARECFALRLAFRELNGDCPRGVGLEDVECAKLVDEYKQQTGA